MLEHVVEVVALHDHVVEFQEAQALLHALLVALGAQHVVDGEAGADLAQQLDIVQRLQPGRVAQHDRLAVGEVDEFLHLALEALRIIRNGLLSEHLAHVGAARRVADHRRAVADEGDGLIARHLQALHQAQGHEMADMQGVCRAVKADIERGLAVVDHFADCFFIRHLRDEAAGDKLVIKFHNYLLFLS